MLFLTKGTAYTLPLTLLGRFCTQEGRQRKGLVRVFMEGWERPILRGPGPRGSTVGHGGGCLEGLSTQGRGAVSEGGEYKLTKPCKAEPSRSRVGNSRAGLVSLGVDCGEEEPKETENHLPFLHPVPRSEPGIYLLSPWRKVAAQVD